MTEPRRVPIPSIFELPLSEADRMRLDNYRELIADKDTAWRRGVWSESEDTLLMNAITLVDVNAINWESVAAIVGTRNGRQCRERYLVKQNPDIRRSPFEPWEDELIVAERLKTGNRWCAIAQLLPGRTSCGVKNRWYSVLRYREAGELEMKVTVEN